TGTAIDLPGAVHIAEGIGYPVLVRPSYVLGGRGMEIVYDSPSLADYFARIEGQGIVGPSHPLLVDRFLDDAIEIDVDALYDGTDLYIGGVMEHIEEAGIHSGDSSCTLPPVTLGRAEIDRVRTATRAIAEGVGVKGLLNVQFAIGAGVLYVLEANPRASRTVPFVSKALGIALAKAASRIMVGASIAELIAEGMLPASDGSNVPLDAPVAVKEAVLPFHRFRTREGIMVDSVLGPEMRSTGEVMGIDRDFPTAFAKSQLAAYGGMPLSGTVFVSVSDRDKRAIILPVLRLQQLGYDITATEGTAEVLRRNGIQAREVLKFSDKPTADASSVVELIHRGEVDVVVNTPSGRSARADGYEIRAAAVAADIPLFTTIAELSAAVASLDAVRGGFEVTSLQEYGARREVPA
ncbi:MAG TPA: carbamoyl phosphate synthase large subunit, partial [Agromyces mariniharenae]|nr:carbamoyl phosphate synthase large subunit [Agromyces mariniharenae]